MKKNINELLKEVEVIKQVKILYACETGSRAWGFPSPDSDYDIRFIYKHKPEWYLSLAARKDSIEKMQGDWDLSGWDLRKSLLLLKKSNAPLIERFQSPIVYFADNSFKKEFSKLITEYYSPIAAFYHHFSLAKKFLADVEQQEQIKLKSFFYLVRSLLSCNWIINNDSVLPMNIHALMIYTDTKRQQFLNDLIELKSEKNEDYLHKIKSETKKWILQLFNTLENNKDKLRINNNNMNSLNDFFIKNIYE